MAGLAKAFGSGAMTNSMPEIEDAACIFIIGSNTTESHPLIASRVLKAKSKGAKIVVADPRKTQIAEYSELYMRQRPGSDVALINGMMNVIISQGWHDKEFIENRTEGFDDLREKVKDYTPEKVEKITGVAKDDIIRAAEMYAKSGKSSILYCMGITQHSTGTDNVLSLCNLSMLTGNIGKSNTGVNPLRGQNNVQGACDMGGLPVVMTAYQSVKDDAARQKFETAWGVELPNNTGLTLMEMMNGADDGSIKALIILGENPLVSDPDLKHVREALAKLELFVVQDIIMTETVQAATVVLAGSSIAEKDGTVTNTDRRVQRVCKATDPIGNAKSDWQIICDLAKAMGASGFDFSSTEEIFDEITSLTPSYHGISYSRLGQDGLQWPCPASDHPGTPFLHKDKFTKGKGTFTAIDFKEPAELPDQDYPLTLTTGRSMFQFHTGTMSRNCPTLEGELDHAYIEINPTDAKSLGIIERELVKVSSRRGEVEVETMVTPRVGKGVVFIPFHFAESAANMLTNTALDPVAKIPEFKVCAVKVEKMGEG